MAKLSHAFLVKNEKKTKKNTVLMFLIEIH